MSPSILHLYEIEYYEVDENKRNLCVISGFNAIDAINALWELHGIPRAQIYSIREL